MLMLKTNASKLPQHTHTHKEEGCCLNVMMLEDSFGHKNSRLRYHLPHSPCPFIAGIMWQYSTLPSVWKLQMWRGWTVSPQLWSTSGSTIRAAEDASQHPCKWTCQKLGSEVCRSDGIHSLTAKQILPSSIKREISHTSTDKVMLQDQTTVMW